MQLEEKKKVVQISASSGKSVLNTFLIDEIVERWLFAVLHSSLFFL